MKPTEVMTKAEMLAKLAADEADARRRVERYSEWVREAQADITRAAAMRELVNTLPD